MLTGKGTNIIRHITTAATLSAVLAGAFPPAIAMGQTISELTEAIETVEGTIQTREDAVAEAQEGLSDTIREAYKNGDLDPNSELAVILSSDSLSDIITSSQYLESISNKYVSSIESAKGALDELTAAKDTLTELKEMRQAQIKSREGADNMHFRQWGKDYSDIRYYCGTIGNAGCGLCAYTVAINILKGTDYTPETMLPVCGDWQGLVHYPNSTAGTPDGTTHAEWTKNYFDVTMETIEGSVKSLREALTDGESVVIALARGYSFKNKSGSWRYTNGHYVCIYRCDDEGFYVQDSSGSTDEDGRAVYYTDAEMKTMISTGTFIKLSN